MLQTTAHTPPGDRYLGFEDGAKTLKLGQGSIGKGIMDIGFKEVS